jgi:hypothetical protein
MANKYLIHGAAFNGDGTSSAEATSDGGTGAWNNINIFQGTAPTYGTLAAGDVVFIRSKSAAGADISVTTAVAMSIGSAAATETAPITWVIDPGVVWPGVSGTVRYDGTARIAITIRDWNNIKAKDYNMVFGNTLTTVTDVGALTLGTGWTEDVECDLSLCSSLTGPFVAYKTSTHFNLYVISNGRYQGLFKPAAIKNTLTLHEPQIELRNASELDAIFNAATGYSTDPVTIYGGRIFGVGSVSGAPLVNCSGTNVGSFRSFGLAYPREMPLSTVAMMTGDKASAYADGADGQFGSEYFGSNYAFSSRSDNNPPTLNATLETSDSAPWSYRVYPHTTSQSYPAQINVSKTWTQADAARTITQEILWPVTMAAPTKDVVYLVIQYIDATTGLPKTVSTRDMAGGTLSTSTAAWSATTWGVVTLDKYKLSAVTPTSIKQDTAVIVSLFVAPRSATVNDVLFVDPDPTFSAP